MFLETVITIAATCFLVTILDSFSQFKTKLPRVGKDPGPFGLRTWWARWKWTKLGHGDVMRAYEESKDSSYVVQTLMGDTIVLAPKFLNELNMLLESKLNFIAALVESVLATFLPLMEEEFRAAIVEQLGQSTVESSITCNAYDLLFSFIHRISSVVFVGKSHCHSPVWTDAVTALAVDVEITKFILLPFPSFLRRFIAPLIPQRNRVFRQRTAVRNVLFPRSEKIGIKDEPAITARLLILTGAALHTSSMAITHAIFDLCSMPEYVEPLRSEAKEALAQDNGKWQVSTIKRLRRLDSFLKESQRVNQSTLLAFDRKVMSPIELSDGKIILPRGAKIVFPGGLMSRDSMFYDDPQRFDGFRFYRPDEDADTTSANAQRDFTGIEPGNLSWGSGRFTCPGRWYAATMIKLIVANLLLDYDISFPPGQMKRPSNTKYDTDVHPDFEQNIVFKKRRNT
ncbi:cytochrome P450 [Hypoxylon trugodes]|uniref:cytochrome P450 n=1 Tax=Hypoxylon trugodes TaxID=326681 RepID=UPI00219D1D32|nr:cytochrome P450 [Hypoxylon trugodes]KAI1384973.1 cytochrome P450 [Hypoxylon trugodes]